MKRFLLFTALMLMPASLFAVDPLKFVPKNASVVAHIDVVKLMASPMGKQLRVLEVDAPQEQPGGETKVVKQKVYSDLQKMVMKATQLDLDDLSTITLVVPAMKQPNDEMGLTITFVMKKEIPKERVLKGLGELNKQWTVGKEVRPGMHLMGDSGFLATFPDDKTICFAGMKVNEVPTDMDTPKLFAAAIASAKNSMAMMAIDFHQFPSNVIGEKNLNPALAAFAPIVFSDLNMLNLSIEADGLAVVHTVQNIDRTKAIDAAESLKAAVTFVKFFLGQVQSDIEKNPAEAAKPEIKNLALPLLKSVMDGMKTSKVESTELNSTLSVKLKNTDVIVPGALTALVVARSTAGQNYTMNNIKQLALAMHNYESTHGHFPPAAICDKAGKPLLSWRVAILPYIEQVNLHRLFKLDEPWDSEHNLKLSKIAVKLFTIPDQAEPFKTHYRVFVGGDKTGKALFEYTNPFKIRHITDGTSNTIMFAMSKDPVIWTKPDELTFDPMKNPMDQLLFRNDQTIIGLADGSVRMIKKSVGEKIFKALITRDGGEVVQIP